MKQYILFDLDGTLTDPKVGITTCVQYALRSFGIDEPDLDKLEPFIGPPLKDSFMEFYQFSEEDAEKAVEKYRERFQETGMFENEMYGGIHDMLRSLKAGGMHLAVASSKPTVFVEKILQHFKMEKYFEVVVGSELDGSRVEKPQVIQEVLHRFFPGGAPRYDEVYMVGDRKYDILGARTFRIESVGVTYGYGSMEELKEAKADYIVSSVPELKRFLMREVEERSRKQTQDGTGRPGTAAKPQSSKLLWQLVIGIVMFYLVKTVATSAVTVLVQIFAMQMPVLEPLLFLKNDAGEIAAFNANASVVIRAIGYLGGAFAIAKTAGMAIRKTADITQLSHLKKEPVKTYLLLALSAIGAGISLNLVMELSGMSALLEVTREGTAVEELPALWLGLIVYGMVVPFTEELLFCGIGYNCIRRFMKTNIAMILTAVAFCTFSHNADNILYSILIGFLSIYAYEYTGKFYLAVMVRMIGDIITYLIGNTVLGEGVLMSVPVCVAAVIALVAGVFFLEREKHLFTNQSILK